MVALEEQAETTAFEAGQEPQLPERVGVIEERSEEELCGCQQRRFIARWGNRDRVDVILDREILIVDPYRAAAKGRRSPHDPAQLRNPDQSLIEAALDHLKIQAAFRVEQWPGFDDAKTTDVLRRPRLLCHEEH